MARKRKNAHKEQKPWCFYCDRVFVDESTLLIHQKVSRLCRVPPSWMTHPPKHHMDYLDRDPRRNLQQLCTSIVKHAQVEVSCEMAPILSFITQDCVSEHVSAGLAQIM